MKQPRIVLLPFSPPPGRAQQGQDAVLPERYKKWLDEEVVYIIAERERDVFLQLRTDRERDIFLEAFWKHRDPTPGTPKNEAEEEHRRRLDHANKFYGRSVPLPGWRTDRGRIYILLGPPQNVEQYSNVHGVYPTEIWFYLGDRPSVSPQPSTSSFSGRRASATTSSIRPPNMGRAASSPARWAATATSLGSRPP
jgi:GWxTD domain-containing protein